MTYKDILNYAVYQSGSMGSDEGLTDLDLDAQTLLKAYVNEAYRVLTRDYYMPYETEETTLDSEGNIDASALSKTFLKLLGVSETKAGLLGSVQARAAVDPINQGYSAQYYGTAIGKPDQVVWIKYSFLFPDLALDTDTPGIPAQNHMALGDYATYRYLSTGNTEKQNRAQVFYVRFMESAMKMLPFGTDTIDISRYSNLYTR